MSGSNWRKDFEFGLIALACALLIALPILGLMLGEYAEVHRANATYQENAERDRKATSEVISKACFETDFAIFSKCITEKIAAYYEQQATNQDLQAQQDMAYWAKTLLILGIFQLGFSAFGIYFIWRSLELNRAAITIARETMVAQTRAWLSIKSVKIQKMQVTAEGVAITAQFQIINSGQSPALRTIVHPTLATNFGDAYMPFIVEREVSNKDSLQYGAAVFTDEPWNYDIGFGINHTEIEHPFFYIRTNIQYETIGSNKVHQTTAQFMIWNQPPDMAPLSSRGIPMDVGEVDLTHIDVRPVAEVFAT